jgi:hypothetical protein
LFMTFGAGSSFQGTAGTWATADYRTVTGAVNTVATSGATFYITGVQLEVGSTATSFDYRPYGTELQLCQRYYYRIKNSGASELFSVGGYCTGTTNGYVNIPFPVTMRTRPTALEQSGTAGDYRVWNSASGAVVCTAVPGYIGATTPNAGTVEFTVASGVVAGNFTNLLSVNSSAYLGWSAEL